MKDLGISVNPFALFAILAGAVCIFYANSQEKKNRRHYLLFSLIGWMCMGFGFFFSFISIMVSTGFLG
ncbi:MAG: hypothetical protein IKL92_03295 [Oscillospiraceae bacterium]|nr:hypothetical protein [Oscillospiraceae bacterium]